MSSIYRKGRDGLFYYQSYLKNVKTGKKDKRIYHALGTRNRKQAELKKIELDNKYNNLDQKIIIWDRSFRVKEVLIGLFFLLGFLYFVKNLINGSHQIITDQISTTRIKPIVETRSFQEKIIVEQKLGPTKQNKREEAFLVETTFNEMITPDYEIVRIKKLSFPFSQAEIHIVVEEGIEEDSLNKLCQFLKEEYEMFENLVICFYSNSEIGRGLASGNKNFGSYEEDGGSWIAMYTFNPIEGPFFNHNPNINQTNF
ncbi:hypothetical protein OAC91_03165 [Candidatus Marinimicrobia bacterium]|nr:hypothetical protein [Candidatus Neomarinimicrobiota bacterium]